MAALLWLFSQELQSLGGALAAPSQLLVSAKGPREAILPGMLRTLPVSTSPPKERALMFCFSRNRGRKENAWSLLCKESFLPLKCF